MTATAEPVPPSVMPERVPPLRWRAQLGPEGALALVVLIAILLTAVLGHRLWPGNAYEVRFDARLQGLSLAHPLGTDQFGRDLLARVIIGSRLTLTGAAAVLFVTSGAGFMIGATSAMLGGWLDALIGRLLDMLLALPALVVALALVGLFGPSYPSLLIAISAATIPWYARIYRSLVLKERHTPYVTAARAIGAGEQRIIWREIFPNIIGPALVVSLVNLGRVVLSLAALSFLGLGAQPPAAEWGAMINEARPFFQSYPHLILAPGLAILLTVVSINLLADCLRDMLDPRSVERR